jgi:hypothetical protein
MQPGGMAQIRIKINSLPHRTSTSLISITEGKIWSKQESSSSANNTNRQKALIKKEDRILSGLPFFMPADQNLIHAS